MPEKLLMRPGVRKEIEPYLPGPSRWFKCQKFGHAGSKCRPNTPKICVTCSLEHQSDGRCTRPPKCANCGEDHPASFKKCKQYLIEKETLRLTTQEGLPYQQARQRAAAGWPEGKLYAAVAGEMVGRSPNGQQEPTRDGTVRGTPREDVVNAGSGSPDEQRGAAHDERELDDDGERGGDPVTPTTTSTTSRPTKP